MKIHFSRVAFGAMASALAVSCGPSNTQINPVDAGADAADASKDSTIADAPADTSTDTTTDSTSRDAADATEAGEGGADGDASSACLPTSGPDGLDAYLTLMDSTKCVVAQYDVPTAPVMTLTWGRHGGPLGFDASDPSDVKIVRWTAPAAATGTLTSTVESHAVSSLPSGPFFWGPQALDLPFFGWTAISYSTTDTASAGELLLVTSAGDDAVARYDVNGFYSETVVGTSDGRLFYTGLSPLSTTTSTTSAGGVYFADDCGTSSSSPRLTPEGDTSCTAPGLYATWQAGSSGPVAVDAKDDVFAFLSTFGGNQELRAFHHSGTGRGDAPVAGTTMFSDTKYTTELTADGRRVYYQPNDPTVAFPAPPQLDVQSLAYTIDDTAKTVSPVGAPSTFLALVTPGTPVALLVDDVGRLWVGVAKASSGDAGPTSSIFYVLADK